jgi:hypothetical protein
MTPAMKFTLICCGAVVNIFWEFESDPSDDSHMGISNSFGMPNPIVEVFIDISDKS